MQFRTKQSRPTGWESQRQGEERLANCIWSAQGRTHREADVEAKSQRKGELGDVDSWKRSRSGRGDIQYKGPKMLQSVSIKKTGVARAESEGEGSGDGTGERMGGGKGPLRPLP